jgi:hypothetical protein
MDILANYNNTFFSPIVLNHKIIFLLLVGGIPNYFAHRQA